MTIDEAIKHAEEVMMENLEKTKGRNASDPTAIKCGECAEEHRQLAEWLKHYKKFRECMSMYYNGRIDKDKCFEMMTDMFTENGRRKEEE